MPRLVMARVQAEPMKVMALLLRDSNPIHFDPASLARLGQEPRVINQGPISVGYVITMLAGWAGHERCITGLHCRFLGNVRAGDRVSVGGEVRSSERSESGATNVTCDVWAAIEGGERVLQGTATLSLPAPA